MAKLERALEHAPPSSERDLVEDAYRGLTPKLLSNGQLNPTYKAALAAANKLLDEHA